MIQKIEAGWDLEPYDNFLKSHLQTTIVMDPPWPEKGGGKVKRGADRHYSVMKKEGILKAVLSSPWQPDKAGCSVWCWTTVNSSRSAAWLMDALGVKAVTEAVWIKSHMEYRCIQCGNRLFVTHVTASPKAFCDGCHTTVKAQRIVIPQHSGLGQHMRIGHETLLYGRIGRVPVPPTYDRMPAEIYAPRSKVHSEKPQAAYDLIARHDQHAVRNVSVNRNLELFARKPRAGWRVWGNEVEDGTEETTA